MKPGTLLPVLALVLLSGCGGCIGGAFSVGAHGSVHCTIGSAGVDLLSTALLVGGAVLWFLLAKRKK